MIQYLLNKYKHKNQGWEMDNQAQTTKPISDDQELAKVLAGVTQQNDISLGLGEIPTSDSKPEIKSDSKIEPKPDSMPTPNPVIAPVAEAPKVPEIEYNPPVESAPVDNNSDLATIKKDALLELRPLIDKLDLAPEEKFDIYLLLLRSTDDTTLISPAHLVARDIADESRRAQALLDIVKEIDYLSGPSQPAI
jgi:hypothetical protein